MLDEIIEYKFRLRLYIHILGTLAVILFAVLQFSRGDFGTAFVSTLGGGYYLLVVLVMLRRQHYLWQGRGFAFFIPFIILNVINLHPEFGVYWAYVVVLGFFLVMELKEACIGTVLFILLASYIISPHYPYPVLLRIIGTLILVGLSAFSFSFLVNQLHSKLNEIATHDPLTKVLNRYTFLTVIKKTINEFNRYQTPATLFIFDLDYFKSVNDQYGHQTGDRVLIEVAQMIKSRIRVGDQLFRYGGEEFAVLLPHTNAENAAKLAEKLRSIIEKQNFNLDRSITFSGGLSEVKAGDLANTWIERCDKGLYQAKSEGRNRISSKGSSGNSRNCY